MLMGLAMSGPISWLLANSMIFAIWLHPERNRKAFADLPWRFGDFKNRPARIVLSAFFLLLSTSVIFGEIEMKEKEVAAKIEMAKMEAAENARIEEDKKSYAVPTIVVKSPSGMQPSRKYVLAYSTS